MISLAGHVQTVGLLFALCVVSAPRMRVLVRACREESPQHLRRAFIALDHNDFLQYYVQTCHDIRELPRCAVSDPPPHGRALGSGHAPWPLIRTSS
jgi:hypothetical protein